MTDRAPDLVPAFPEHPPIHRERLRAMAESRAWGEILRREAALGAIRESVRGPPEAPGQQAKASEYLAEQNGARVRRMIDEGVSDEARLLAALGDWEAALASGGDFPIVFLGLVLTLDCSFLPRCVYCNQLWLPRRLTLSHLKALVEEAAEPVPPYVYLTGGEPLLTGAEVWGDDGLVAFATRRGSAVNINTNAALITPGVAIQLVKVGTAKLHISVDSVEEAIGDGLLGRPERTSAVLSGILNVQIARELLGARHPTIHVNCVLTARNLDSFPDLLRALLGMRRRDAASDDFAIHLIPVGGSENSLLRPTAAEWERFYTETWARAEEVWTEHKAATGVAEEDRESLPEAFPFLSPWHRVRHGATLPDYCRLAARGEYWQEALTDRCYVAPTQAFVLPDGSQHWCGAHAIRRPPPLGDATAPGLRENIRRNIAALAACPNEHCTGCAGATCAINQAAERNLLRRIAQWKADRAAGPPPA